MFEYPQNRVFIIAEAGVNHNGNVDLAKSLVDVAVQAGADAVKFQLFDPKKLTVHNAPMAQYQASNIGQEAPQQEMLQSLTLPLEAYVQLQAYAKSQGILFLCTPFDWTLPCICTSNYRCRCLKFPRET